MKEWTHLCPQCLPGAHMHAHTRIKSSLLTPTLPSRVLRPLSSPFLCLEVELLLVLWFPSFPLPVPLDKDVDDWLTVLFRLGCSAFGVRWSPDKEGEGTGSSFFSSDLFDLVGQIYFNLLAVFPSQNTDFFPPFLNGCNTVSLFIYYLCIFKHKDPARINLNWCNNECSSYI